MLLPTGDIHRVHLMDELEWDRIEIEIIIIKLRQLSAGI